MKKNVLWLMSDEQRPDSLGCGGSAWAKTPNLDRVAADGCVFRNAVCPSPVCLPSRTSVAFGREAHEFACMNNMLLHAKQALPVDWISWPQLLAREGYQTVNFGRYHCMRSDVFATNEMTPDCFQKYAGYFGVPAGIDEKKWNMIKRPGEDGRTLILAGTYPGGDDNPNHRSASRAVEFLRNWRKGDAPFLLRVSFNWPHTPTLAPEPFDRLYRPHDLPIRRFDGESLSRRSNFDKLYARLHRMDLLAPEQVDQLWKDYFGCCAYVDAQAGRVLNALRECELEENTIVFFHADHGKMLGEYGSGEKFTYDRWSWGVPLLFRCPGSVASGQVCTDPVSTISIGRTVMALLGLEDRLSAQWRGKNLFGGACGNEAVCSAVRPPIDDDPGFPAHLMRAAIRTRQWRMDVNWRMDGRVASEDERDGGLYDVENDPDERRNLFGEPGMENVKKGLIVGIEKWFEECPPDPRLARVEMAGKWF